jgi:hypothetical protein
VWAVDRAPPGSGTCRYGCPSATIQPAASPGLVEPYSTLETPAVRAVTRSAASLAHATVVPPAA